MLNFKKIELSDKSWVDEIILSGRTNPNLNCVLNFTNCFLWGQIYNLHIAKFNDTLLSCTTHNDQTVFAFPQGFSNPYDAICELIKYAQSKNIPFVLNQVTAENKKFLEENFSDTFDIKPLRDSFNYIYTTEKLAYLKGKSLHSKRNHINKFKTTYSYSYEDMSLENIPECIKMCEDWYNLEGNIDNPDLAGEKKVLLNAFENFSNLGLRGGVLRVDNNIVAICLGSSLCYKTFCVHFEKAFYHVTGAYTMINHLFANSLLNSFDYINREEDLGDEGLRKSKLSYKPDILFEIYEATMK